MTADFFSYEAIELNYILLAEEGKKQIIDKQ